MNRKQKCDFLQHRILDDFLKLMEKSSPEHALGYLETLKMAYMITVVNKNENKG